MSSVLECLWRAKAVRITKFRSGLLRHRIVFSWRMWPEISARQHADELLPLLEGKARLTMPSVNLVADAKRELVGLVEVSLRSHADGCDPSRPVGFIEGWCAREKHRRQGIGSRLLAAAEDWARLKGCLEMSSDARIDNQLSQWVHEPRLHGGGPLCALP
jgi:aminoglycoside 6'-N-acetyltransferase I